MEREDQTLQEKALKEALEKIRGKDPAFWEEQPFEIDAGTEWKRYRQREKKEKLRLVGIAAFVALLFALRAIISGWIHRRPSSPRDR